MIKTIKVATAFTLGVSTLSTTTLSASAVTYKVNKQGKLVNSKGKLVKGFKKYKNLLYKDGKKFTGIRSNNYYKAGKLATGDYKSIFYSKGVAYTGIAKNSKKYAGLYVKKGKPSTGDYKNVYYVVGKKYTGIAKQSKLYKNQYVKNGKPGTGIITKKQYVKGKLVSGKYGKYVYVNGMKAQDLYKEVFYENGLVATGIASNNLYYVKGDLATGEYNDVYYTNGIVTMSKEELALQKARTALTDAQLVVQETKAQLVALLLLEQQLNGEATELQVTKQLRNLATTDEIASFITELKEKDLAHLTVEEKEAYLVRVGAYKKEVLAKLQEAVESVVSSVVKLNECIQQSLEASATTEQLTAIYEQLAEVLKAVKASVQDVEGIDVDFSKADEALQLARETLGITLPPEIEEPEEPVEVKPPTNTGNTGGNVPAQSIRVTSMDTLASITTVNGENPLLPSTINAVTTTNNTTFPIIWNTPTNFNPTVAGEYTFTGTFIIPTGYVLTSGMTNQVSVKVIVAAKVLTEAEKTTVAEDAVNALFTNANKEAIAKNVSAETITEAKTKVEALASSNTERARLLEDIKKATSFLLEVSTNYANSTTIVHVRMPNAANGTKVRIEIFNGEGSSIYSNEAELQNGKLDLSISSGTIVEGSGYVVQVTANTLTASSEPFIIDTTAPKIAGVVDGQATQQNITPTTQDTDIATVELTKNKASIKDYKLGTELTEEGQYSLEVTDKAGNKTTVEFQIDRTAPEMGYGHIDKSSGMMTVHFSEELAVFDGMTVKKLVDGDKVPGSFTLQGMDINSEIIDVVHYGEYDAKRKAVVFKVSEDLIFVSYLVYRGFELEKNIKTADLAGNIMPIFILSTNLEINKNFEIYQVKQNMKESLTYAYSPSYTYKGIFELSKDSSNVTMKYDQSTSFQLENILDDLNHYLGALYKTKNSFIEKITFNNKEYRWNESSTSLDSKWESEGTSLTEEIKAERNQLDQNGLSLTLHHKGENGVVNVTFRLD